MNPIDFSSYEYQHEITKALANVYFCTYVIDIDNDEFEIVQAKPYVIKLTGLNGCASKVLTLTNDKLTTPEHQEAMYSFGDITTLKQRLATEDSIFHEFKGNVMGWCRAGFICITRDADGAPTHCLYTIQLIDKEKQIELQHQTDLERQYVITRSLADIYNSAHYINLNENRFIEITSNPFIVKAMGHEGNATDALDMVAHMFATDEYVKIMEEFVDFSTLKERLSKNDTLYQEFVGKFHGWTRAGFVVSRRDEAGAPTHAIFTTQTIDAAKQKELQLIAELKEAVAAANRATAAKSNFLSHMSHEIRTPINAVLGMNEMILRESKEKNILEYASTIAENGNALLSIINSVLDFSKIESGHIDILPEAYELSSLISDCYHLVFARAQGKKLGFNVKCDSTLPASLIGDMPHIRQIITNLLTNAIKYTPQGHIDFIIHGEGEGNDFTLIVDVKDTGIGLKESDIDRLFGEFERFDLETNQSVEGTGLGLAISKQLAQIMGGDITVTSVYGEGSTFTLTLPQPAPSKALLGELNFAHSAEQLIAVQKKEHYKAPGKKILVVDDVAINLTVFTKLISKSEIISDMALSGEEALQRTLDKKYDLIFMDHMMPGMNGVDTMLAIKNQENGRNLDTPIIMLTANAIGGMREQYLKAGFVDYLSKPIQPDKLEDMLRQYLQ